MESELATEARIIARLMSEQRGNEGWAVRLRLDECPQLSGHYALYDGLDVVGAGVTLNIRKSLDDLMAFRTLKRPIFLWLHDLDGSARRWLDR